MNRKRAVQLTYFLLRVVAGVLFFTAGGLILFGWFGGMPGQPSPPPLASSYPVTEVELATQLQAVSLTP